MRTASELLWVLPVAALKPHELKQFSCLLSRTLDSRHAFTGHGVPQGTFSSRGPSLAPQFTLSRLAAIHLVLRDNSPCEYFPVSSTAASVGNCSCIPSKGPTLGALPSPIPGLVLPTVPQRHVGYPMYSFVYN